MHDGSFSSYLLIFRGRGVRDRPCYIPLVYITKLYANIPFLFYIKAWLSYHFCTSFASFCVWYDSVYLGGVVGLLSSSVYLSAWVIFPLVGRKPQLSFMFCFFSLSNL